MAERQDERFIFDKKKKELYLPIEPQELVWLRLLLNEMRNVMSLSPSPSSLHHCDLG